jgi:ribosomal protein S30
MRKPTGKMRQQEPRLLAETTQRNARFTEIRKQTGKMRQQEPRLLAETTQMSKQNGKTRKQIANRIPDQAQEFTHPANCVPLFHHDLGHGYQSSSS